MCWSSNTDHTGVKTRDSKSLKKRKGLSCYPVLVRFNWVKIHFQRTVHLDWYITDGTKETNQKKLIFCHFLSVTLKYLSSGHPWMVFELMWNCILQMEELMFPRDETEMGGERGYCPPGSAFPICLKQNFFLKTPLYAFSFTAQLTLSSTRCNLCFPAVTHLRNLFFSCAPGWVGQKETVKK